MSYKVNDIRDQFPPFKNNKKEFIYMDNACTTLRPQSVIESITDYYNYHPSCHNRALHTFGKQTTEKFSEARSKISKFVNAKSANEIIFTKNTTEAINIIAKGINWQSGDCILTTDMEHNSNLLPWQFLAKEKEVNHLQFDVDVYEGSVDLSGFEKILKENKVKLVSFFHTSNVSGITLPVRKLTEIAKKYGAIVLVDCAQAMITHKVDVQDLGADFIAFSMHKSFGPSGFGILYGKSEQLELLTPMIFGGETVVDAYYDSCTFSEIPFRFEAGLQNYSGAIGSSAAIDFIEDLGQENIKAHLLELNTLLTDALAGEDRVKIIGPKDPALRPSILNFTIENLDMAEVSVILDKSHRIMVRSGVHCCHAWYHKQELKPTLRVSLSVYNTVEEIKTFIKAITPIIRFY
ncbi:hypothetical protein A9Q84_19900 [Halobacteriovorax marinus]|uniref:Probable cysteine desulfurase n=1 Tax=Halobacteriovorax marinus TaxID=97084 RepID=A0A1Y5F8J8_9BACT|nr:hypothetical protein A9Q84_19900 [Halobacteriovorax marinus]